VYTLEVPFNMIKTYEGIQREINNSSFYDLPRLSSNADRDTCRIRDLMNIICKECLKTNQTERIDCQDLLKILKSKERNLKSLSMTSEQLKQREKEKKRKEKEKAKETEKERGTEKTPVQEDEQTKKNSDSNQGGKSFKCINWESLENVTEIVINKKEHTEEDGGNFSTLYRATWFGKMVALKGISKKASNKTEAVEEEQNLEREFSFVYELRHPSIIECYGWTRKPQDKTFCLIFEWMKGDNLRKQIKKYTINDSININAAIQIMITIVEGMRCLESQNVAHGDLALRNILVSDTITPQNLKQLQFKISDFGFAQMSNDDWDVPYYDTFMAAPEILNAHKRNAPRLPFSPKSDVYAFGVLCWELLNNGADEPTVLPPEFDDKLDYFLAVSPEQRLTFPTTVTTALLKVVKSCWAIDEKNRPTFAQLNKELVDLL